MKNYLRVHWYHALLFEPIVFYWELDEARAICRAVEIYTDNSMRTATEAQPNPSLLAGTIPTIDEINADDNFFALEISQADFDTIWEKALAPPAELPESPSL